ncbi:MAG TPA: histidine kinase, partial [Thermomicrobiales bacterium]|nr:histidine kinase [Thermomicrobiales bacterium]
YGAAANGVPTSREWLANRAERVNVAVGVRCLPEPHPATESQHILASATEILASHDAAIAAARMDALQGERARIASEIHQGAVQEIATVTLQLQLLTQISEMDPLSTRTLLSEVCDTARNCAQSLRSALIDLTPPTTRDSALVPVLSQMIERFVDACGLQVDLEVTGTPRAVWPEAVSLVLSFVQEGLTNMNKHSGDGEGRVRLSFGLDQLTVTVTNESAGHAWNGALENTPLGHGLSIMRARARLLGGDIAIKAGSSGTELSLEVPD